MGWIVRSTDGQQFELRIAEGSANRHLSLRAVIDRHARHHDVLRVSDNHDAFVEVLRELDPTLGASSLSTERALGMVTAAIEAGTLEVVSPERNLRPVCDVSSAPAPLTEELVAEDEPEVEATHTFEFVLVDSLGNPVASEPYRVGLPDGQVVEGTTNAQGGALITGIASAGNCTLEFTRRALDDWAVA